jgi:hypothetical protein
MQLMILSLSFGCLLDFVAVYIYSFRDSFMPLAVNVTVHTREKYKDKYLN